MKKWLKLLRAVLTGRLGACGNCGHEYYWHDRHCLSRGCDCDDFELAE